MEIEEFRKDLLNEIDKNLGKFVTRSNDWTVKGFIDIFKNIYTISIDTKVVSKVLELMLFPIISSFCGKKGIKLIVASAQNHYPDLTFILPDNTKIAMDIKSAYRENEHKISGFTLGSFTGYFRNRSSSKNSTLPYSEYSKHFVLGVIYTRKNDKVDEGETYKLDQLESIESAICDLDFIIQEKYRIASYLPGSGNTRNIGSIRNIDAIRAGNGPFAKLGEKIFDDYWMFYQTRDMAKNISPDGKPPYSNLTEYAKYKKMGSDLEGRLDQFEEEDNQ